ncbi:MAG: DUF5615 family PIN-like protein [Acidobacteriota bacterium]|nr:DUF5615 family PIN-like protein [Acidobacteriota bacterium]
MRILLDECVNAGVKIAFTGHTVRTVTQIGWRSSKDGPLLAFAQTHFDVFVTIDRKLGRQHNLKEFKMGFVVARILNNKIESYQAILARLKAAAEAVKPGQVVVVISPELKRPSTP